MEFFNNLIYCVSQTMGVIPLISHGIGFLGCNLAAFSDAWNALHCLIEGGAGIKDIIMPIFGQMTETFGGGKGG